MNPKNLFLWGHPRSLSTAMEVYFRSRGDFQVVHEPFADAYWQGIDPGEAVQKLKTLANTNELPIFVKDIAHHLPKQAIEDIELISIFTHVVIVRSPLAAFHSHLKVNPEVKPHEFGYQALFEAIVKTQELTGRYPYILLADEVLKTPSKTIQKLCSSIGLQHLAEALSWEAEEQKDWRAAQKWQAKAASSIGFEKASNTPLPPVPKEYEDIFEFHRNYYLKILALASD